MEMSLAFLVLIITFAMQLNLASLAEGRAFFVFGDSLVDSGNNDFLATTARADSPPYGIDFPSHRATGRFSNGFNMADLISCVDDIRTFIYVPYHIHTKCFIGLSIGSEPTLPYLNPALKGERLLIGANFASAGVGILNDTGFQFVNIIHIYKQLKFFHDYQWRLSKLIGKEKAKQLVNSALVLITLGGNDFVNNYYLVPFSLRSRQFRLPDYVTYLISEYSKILKRLHDMGARRVLVTGTGPMGCVPAELAQHSANGECWPQLQLAASLFNSQLVQMLSSLNRDLGSDVFIAANVNDMHMDFVSNPRAYGFVTSKIACCGQGPYNGLGLCTPASSLCANRDTYVFWDNFHPSERANKIIVQKIFTGSSKYMKPMNLSTVMAIDSSKV